MSEQEKKCASSGGSVVMVEKTASSRHKPYRPTELQEEPAPDLHKRSKAPAVPSVAEELKNITVSEAPRESMECERVVSEEKHIHASKNKSSIGKRQVSSPEEIAMDTIDVMKDNLATSPQPIPAHIETVVSEISAVKSAEKTDLQKRADDDSITEEIAELRTPDAAVKDHSEWPTLSAALKKKEISWRDHECLEEVDLQKSVRTMSEQFNSIPSVININISQRSVLKSTSCSHNCSKHKSEIPEKVGLKIEPEERHQTFSSVIRTKLDNMSNKIRKLLI